LSKVAIIADFHFGIKKANNLFLKSQINFVKQELVPYLIENKIDTLFILGDLFDNRNHINIKVKNSVFDLFENELKQFKIYIILGNHDIYYNSTLEVNSIKFLSKFENITVIDTIREIDINGNKFFFVPWQVDVNSIKEYIANHLIESKICLGHLDLQGFKLNKYKINDMGMKSDIFFSHFKLLFTGHFHTRNKQKQGDSEIIYVGAPYHLTRNDIDEEKGFCILDTDTMTYEYVNNETSIRYIVLNYPQPVSKSLIKGNIIDVFVKYDENYSDGKFQSYLKKIEECNPICPPNVKIVTEQGSSIDMENYKSLSVFELMQEYINNNPDIKDKAMILSILDRLYHECKSDI
jgi:DNA repair exonuclease SbcCD nuclease subunit